MAIDNKDKFAEREAENYDNPIASREFILDLLEEQDALLSYGQIASLLNIDSEEHRIALQRRLRAMERDGQIIRNRKNAYGLASKMQLVCGYVSAHPDGFGFLIPDEAGEDLFLSARQMRRLFHRDRVLASVIGVDRRGRREGAVVEVLQRNTHELVGRYFKKSGVGFVEPDSKQITHDVVIPLDNEAQAVDGQIVMVQILEQPTKRHQPIGRVTEILGEHMAAGMEIDIAIRAHDLPNVWSAEVLHEVQKYSPEVKDGEKKDRQDLRHLPLVTIDGADARDFDDAVYCEKQGRNWRLIVAIADVAHYVKIGSALDKEALERGNSVYFPERVIPMLPEALSNGLCSLNPDVDRLCMVCDMTITATGNIKSFEFYNAVFRSHARLIYDDVAALIDGDKALRDQHKALIPYLENLFSLYHVLLSKRQKRGAIEFETTETLIHFDENRKIDRITPLQRNDAHKMIEECMISAN
ncbi:MAG: ribonuclease R family protein, partial [Thiohalomonadales bacterium]